MSDFDNSASSSTRVARQDAWKIHMSIRNALSLLATHHYLNDADDNSRTRNRERSRRLRELRGDMFAIASSALTVDSHGTRPCTTASQLEDMLIRMRVISNPSRVVSEIREYLEGKSSDLLRRAVADRERYKLVEAIYGLLGGKVGSSRARVDDILKKYPAPFDLVAQAKAIITKPPLHPTKTRSAKGKCGQRGRGRNRRNRCSKTLSRGDVRQISLFEATCLVRMSTIFRPLDQACYRRLQAAVTSAADVLPTIRIARTGMSDGNGRRFLGTHVIVGRNNLEDNDVVSHLETAFRNTQGIQLTVLRRMTLSTHTTRVDAMVRFDDKGQPPTQPSTTQEDTSEATPRLDSDEEARQRLVIDITSDSSMPFRLLHAVAPIHIWAGLRMHAQSMRPPVPFDVDGWVHSHRKNEEMSNAIDKATARWCGLDKTDPKVIE